MLRITFAGVRAAAVACFLLFLVACGSSGSSSSVSISTTSLPTGTVGVAYSATINVSGGTAPYAFSTTSGNLPGGLTLSPGGVLSGTPTVATATSFVISVLDAKGLQARQAYTLDIAPATNGTGVSITTSSLPGGTVGTAYSATLAAQNGTAPYTFTATAGNLPNGLNLASNGLLSGTPTTAGSFSFTATVTDAAGNKASASYTIVISAAGTPVSITTSTLPSGTVGATYTTTIAAANGTSPYTFTVSSGSVPTGLNLATSGVLSGTPTASGSFGFTVTVADANGQKASATYTVTIAAATATPVSITTATLPSGTVGVAYSSTIAAANGTAPYSFAVTSGNLPNGLNLAAGGGIAGTPSAAGSFSFTVTVTDAKGQTAGATFTVVIAAAGSPLTITTTSLPSGTVGTTYSSAILTANGTAPYSFTLNSGSLPPGLGLTDGGILAGSPTATGTYAFTVSVTDAKGQKATASYSVAIAAATVAPISIATTTVPSGTVGTSYYTTILASDNEPYLFTSSGNVPPGLVVSRVGVLSGTPTSAGTFTFTVYIESEDNRSASRTYTLVVAPAVTPISIVTTALPSGTVGVAYSAPVIAANGTAPYTFTASTGVPAGLTLSTGGVLSGTPTVSGSSSFTVTATDAASQKISANYTVAVAAGSVGTLTLTSATLPVAVIGTNYTAQLQINGGTAPFGVTQSTGTMPPGITVSASGVLTGVPYATGTYGFGARVTDGGSPQQTATANFTLTVVNATVAVNTAAALTTVPQSFFGMHTSVYDTSLNDVSRLPALLQTTGVTTLRYPGGSYADRYHWAQFSLTPLYGSTAPACSQLADGYLGAGADFGSFAKTLAATGAQAVITVNYGTSVANSSGSLTPGNTGVANHCSEPNAQGQPQEAAAWVAYANGSPSNTQVIGLDAVGFDWKTVGFWAGLRAATPISPDDGYNFLRIGEAAPIGIKYWEVGNEMYYNGWAGNRNFEADLHAPYIYPSGYSGSYDSRDQLDALSPTAYGTNAAPFIQAMKAVDPTILIGVDFSSPGATDPIPLNWNPDLARAVCAATNIDLAIIHYYPGTYNAVQPSELLSLPQTDIPRVISGIEANLAQSCPANASSIKFLLTETSPNGNLAGGFPAQVTGLFALNEYLASLQSGVQNIDWLELHNGTYLDEAENPGPAYYGIQLAHLLAGVGDSLVSATSSSPTVLSYATLKANGQKGVLLVNASASTSSVVQVTVAGSTLGSSATEYSYGISSSQNGTALAGTAFPISGNSFTVTIPAYTAIELTIP